jgi:uncharacterized membrane protein
MMVSDEFALLQEEYFHLHRTVEDFDQRALTIKSWSVTTSMAGIAAGFLQNEIAVLCLLAALASLLFWLIEALWKVFQQCYYTRIRAIERVTRDPQSTERPLQILTSWFKTWESYNSRKILGVMFLPQVALPHVIIVAGGLGICIWQISLHGWA